jgi:N-acetylglutamate synthase
MPTVDVRGLQERAARALPARRVVMADGWWLREAPGCSWWVRSVLPHGGVDDLRRRVEEAERFHGKDARFQISPGVCPDALDAELAERGYRGESPMSLMAASTERVAESPEGHVRVDSQPTSAWFGVWDSVLGHGADADAEWELLGRVTAPSAYASVLDGDEVVAVCRAVADSGWTGLFGMATLPSARGRGAGRALLAALAEWSAGHGAGGMYLQVERDNAPALRLYGRAGFREVCGYHYRRRPPP